MWFLDTHLHKYFKMQPATPLSVHLSEFFHYVVRPSTELSEAHISLHQSQLFGSCDGHVERIDVLSRHIRLALYHWVILTSQLFLALCKERVGWWDTLLMLLENKAYSHSFKFSLKRIYLCIRVPQNAVLNLTFYQQQVYMYYLNIEVRVLESHIKTQIREPFNH